MMIDVFWLGQNNPLFIFVTKNKVEISRNPLINESCLRLIDIPNNIKGKQMWFWIVVRDKTIDIVFSGISSSIKRSFITKNIYDRNSEAYQKVRESEITKETIIKNITLYIYIYGLH